MVQFGTPSFFFRLPSEINLEEATDVIVTLRQGGLVVSKSKSNNQLAISGNTVNAFFTQADTRNFSPYMDAKVQVNWFYSGNNRACTKPQTVYVGENLYKEIMS